MTVSDGLGTMATTYTSPHDLGGKAHAYPPSLPEGTPVGLWSQLTDETTGRGGRGLPWLIRSHMQTQEAGHGTAGECSGVSLGQSPEDRGRRLSLAGACFSVTVGPEYSTVSRDEAVNMCEV